MDNNHKLTRFSDISESNSVQEDHLNDRSIDCEYKGSNEIVIPSKTNSKQTSTDDQIGSEPKREFEYYYNMNNKNRGLALIFNHEKYHNDIGFRDGTRVDSDRLRETLHLLNFDVRVYDDLLSHDVSQVLEEGTLLLIS